MWSRHPPMLPHQYFFRALLILACGYALWRGRSDERLVALVCLGAVVATKFAISPLSDRYSDIEVGLLLVDLFVLGCFLYVALRSERFWPLWVAGLQLTSSTGHLMKAIDLDLLPRAYGAAAALWSYPILVLLLIGTWRGHQRRKREQGLQPAL